MPRCNLCWDDCDIVDILGLRSKMSSGTSYAAILWNIPHRHMNDDGVSQGLKAYDLDLYSKSGVLESQGEKGIRN